MGDIRVPQKTFNINFRGLESLGTSPIQQFDLICRAELKFAKDSFVLQSVGNLASTHKKIPLISYNAITQTKVL